jgi:hypothetical protein
MERARRNRRSLNQQVIAELSDTVDSAPIDEAGRKCRRAEQMILAATRVRAVMPRYMNAEEINAAIQEGRITLTL